MKTHRVTSIRIVLCVAAGLCLAALFSRQAIGNEAKIRPAAALTVDERMRLPDTTMVRSRSGQTVSLGTLRAEHRARLDRFARAAGLGQTIAAKLALHPRKNDAIGGGGGKQSYTKVQTQMVPVTDLAVPSKVPFQIPNYSGTIPKDYLDFCKAANPSVCIYLPANNSGRAGATWVVDIDDLITDRSVCDYDGGVFADDGPACMFYYPYVQSTNFKPTGALTTAEACDLPFKYVVDPKGAIQASYPSVTSSHSGLKYVVVGGAPATCVVQVWISPG